MISKRWHIAVLIPARNEEALLPRCLDSVEQARRALPGFVTSDVVVAVDSSEDRTAALARKMLGSTGEVLCVEEGVVGRVRARAAQSALSRYRGPLDHCWLANTDADCIVPESWLQRHLEIATRGFQAAAGIIDVDSFEEHEEVVFQRFRLSYLIHADSTHPHVHGANLGVRADAYLRAGGWPLLPSAEDHALWKRLGNEARLSDTELRVLTSGRRIGRAPNGFAQALAAHNENEL